MEGTSTVNLVPFGSGITELRMRENRDFVVPVNISLRLRAPRFLEPHDTLPFEMLIISCYVMIP